MDALVVKSLRDTSVLQSVLSTDVSFSNMERERIVQHERYLRKSELDVL